MENFNVDLPFVWVWVISFILILLIALYGFFRCEVSRVETAIVVLVGFLPVFNTLILVMFCYFAITDGPKRNGVNQH